MNIMIDTQKIEVPAGQHRRLAGRFGRVFNRLDDAIQSIRVKLRTASARPGQEEKICQLEVTLADGGHVVVTGRGRRMAKAIGQTLRKGRYLVGKEIGKRRARSRRSRQLALATSDLTA